MSSHFPWRILFENKLSGNGKVFVWNAQNHQFVDAGFQYKAFQYAKLGSIFYKVDELIFNCLQVVKIVCWILSLQWFTFRQYERYHTVHMWPFEHHTVISMGRVSLRDLRISNRNFHQISVNCLRLCSPDSPLERFYLSEKLKSAEAFHSNLVHSSIAVENNCTDEKVIRIATHHWIESNGFIWLIWWIESIQLIENLRGLSRTSLCK